MPETTANATPPRPLESTPVPSTVAQDGTTHVDTTHATAGVWRRARLTAELLRDQLMALGLTEEETRRIAARSNLEGDGFVYLGTLSVEGAELLLAALPGRAITEPEATA